MTTPAIPEEDRHLERELVTPEGIPVTVKLANAGDRLGAACVDLFFVINGTFLILLLASLLVPKLTERSLAGSSALFIAFVLRLIYYPAFELAWRGQTPGKRILGLRVTGRDGAGLTADAAITRSLMREVELWLPMSLVLSINLYSDRGETWTVVLSCLWLTVLCSLPLINRDVMRAGDMMAGTWVVNQPAVVLLPDLAAPAKQRKATYMFSRQQLDVYGIHELEMLANVLRDTTPDASRLQATVAQTIQKKTGVEPIRGEATVVFLSDYYLALRRHLEQKLLFGKRRLSKYDVA